MMDYNKKHEISVYLTEEQLDKRGNRCGNYQTFCGRVRIPCLHIKRINFLYHRACKKNRTSDDYGFYVCFQLWSRNSFIWCG